MRDFLSTFQRLSSIAMSKPAGEIQTDYLRIRLHRGRGSRRNSREHLVRQLGVQMAVEVLSKMALLYPKISSDRGSGNCCLQ